MPAPTAIIPCLGYADAPAAIDFLCEAFGFTRHAVHASEDGRLVHHAQLKLGSSMIKLNSTSTESRERFGTVNPIDAKGLVTGSLYVVLHAVDADHDIASAHGAAIILAPHDNDYGGRSYEARDCEGYMWSFGSYDPFK